MLISSFLRNLSPWLLALSSETGDSGSSSTEVPSHSRCGTIKIPPCSKALGAEYRPKFWSPSFKWKILEWDVNPSIINQSIFSLNYCFRVFQLLWNLLLGLQIKIHRILERVLKSDKMFEFSTMSPRASILYTARPLSSKANECWIYKWRMTCYKLYFPSQRGQKSIPVIVHL